MQFILILKLNRHPFLELSSRKTIVEDTVNDTILLVQEARQEKKMMTWANLGESDNKQQFIHFSYMKKGHSDSQARKKSPTAEAAATNERKHTKTVTSSQNEAATDKRIQDNNCGKLGNQNDVITYLENRIKELERKIDFVEIPSESVPCCSH